MTQALAHRGPNADGHFVRPGVALGHRRLSIIDLSTAANQPITDPSGRYTIIYNGEVYNYREIRALLPDYAYGSDSDTDVILAAYAAWGPACLTHFNGMFAFAIWDAVEETLFVARDRLGIKPLYYHFAEGRLTFASEVRALLASGRVARRLNRDALSEYLRYYSVNAPRTLLQDVWLLPPGHWGRWQAGTWETQAYWRLDAPPEAEAPHSYEAACAGVRERLLAAVSRRLVSDVPFGAFLSGGIDSSAIVALMATASSTPVHTFSVGFDEKAYDESPYAEQIARRYGTAHHPIRLRPEDFLAGLSPALAAMDHPSGDGLNSYVVSQATKATGFTVALSGLGGDELFGGYPVFGRYQRLRGWQPFYRVPQGLRRAGARAIATVYHTHKTARLQELVGLAEPDFAHLYPVFRKIYADPEIQTLLGQCEDPAQSLAGMFPPDALARIEQLPTLSQVTVGEIGTYTQHVLLRDTDQMSMAHALEVRVPFFDHTLVEYVLRIPDAWKPLDSPKKLLVDALGDLLPPEIVNRPKMGFMFPWVEWLRGPLQGFCQERLEALAGRGIFQAGAVEAVWQGFLQASSQISWIKVWMLVALEDWLHQNDIHA